MKPSKVNLDEVNITDELKQQVKEAVAAVKVLLPFLIDLTIEERKKGHKIGIHRRDLANEMRDVANDHPEILPPAFDVDYFKKAVQQEKPLEDISTWAMELNELLNDTHLDVGRIEYYGALDVYKYLMDAEGLDELKKKAKEYFEKAKKEEEETAAEGTTPEEPA